MNQLVTVKYIAIYKRDYEGYSVEKFDTQEELEQFLNDTHLDLNEIEIYQAIPFKIKVSVTPVQALNVPDLKQSEVK